MTRDEPLCENCKNYQGSRLCKKLIECPNKVFEGGECVFYQKITDKALLNNFKT